MLSVLCTALILHSVFVRALERMVLHAASASAIHAVCVVLHGEMSALNLGILLFRCKASHHIHDKNNKNWPSRQFNYIFFDVTNVVVALSSRAHDT